MKSIWIILAKLKEFVTSTGSSTFADTTVESLSKFNYIIILDEDRNKIAI